ncbi:hypothetical protein [Clostridium sp.]|uniref:hypothetical protein n=1 Tax=Clostridium sp. TaxID=1506 RepID=UPI00262A831B
MMINWEFIISFIVVACIIYLIYVCYGKYLEKKQRYLKALTIFLIIEVLRRIFIYGKVNSSLISGLSFIQLIFLLISVSMYGFMYLKNNLS